ncbi:glycine cleavage system aminomethyltransferase GcvT [Virgibacillus halophilus]|uniref:glycine cleavage system aminomethyltransferase GcvT n=1 Tax=Tigheibacillus halophilus TaxID=361280 RepID=UPI00362B3904
MSNTLKTTPLYPEYAVAGAKTIDFGGWDLPVQFSGIIHEHEVTRTKAGLFDVSHMGEIHVSGPKSRDFLQWVLTNDIDKLTPQKAQYTFLCYENGGTVDDLLVYMLGEQEYLLVVNAANTEKDYEWLLQNNEYDESELQIKNESADYAQLALQGPAAEEILQKLTDTNLADIKFFRFEKGVRFTGISCDALVSRTGYTGEDGFEIYLDKSCARNLWRALLNTGKEYGLEPIGLGARDTLRFEANLPLYGQELSKDITPVEAGLKFAVKIGKDGDFIGKEALKQQIENGTARKLVGIEMIDKGIPRTGYQVFHQDEEIGFVTTGTQAPTLQKNIGLALIKSEFAKEGQELIIQIRKRKAKAKIIATPFLKK